MPRTTHPLTRAGSDLGRAGADVPMDRILMQLTSSPEQEAELEQLIADQHDPASPQFRRWLTPEEFAARFAPAQADIDAVTQWLQGQGFQVGAVARGGRSLEFSGTAQQVEQAFQTEIHQYLLNGESHIANSRDIAVPEALSPVIGGVASLHNFHSRPMHRLDAQGGEPVPFTNLSTGDHSLSPYDFAAIYNVAPLWNNGFDGSFQSVAIAGRTNIRPSDIASFRSMFGLPANNPQIIVNGADPGIISSSEEIEADLDVEWAGGVGKGAAVKFVVSKSTNSSDGVDLSTQYIVNNNLAPVMSVSFGACEAGMGSGNGFYNSLWQQAAAQGISVFVSAGDSGSALCDSAGSTSPATHGFAVNGLASTPYNVAVGGTQFADTVSPSTYWKSANDAHLASAIGYIPEVVWNESSYSGTGASTNNLFAGSGGISQIYARPSWQTGAGVPAGDPGATSQHHRYLPDVSLNGAGHDGYLVVRAGNLYLVGGTSASSPAFAGMMAIVNHYTGGRNGNPNTRLYSLAAQTPAAFHDVTGGTNAVPCAGGSPNCSTPSGTVGVMTGYAAGPGYDLATGLGSVDAWALALNWGAHPNPGPAIGSLSPNPMTGSASPQPLTINGSGFAAGATVTATYAGGPTTTLAVSSLSSTQITTSIATGTTARTWSIVVKNSNGQASAPASLVVNAPAAPPAIASLSPNPMTGSNGGQVLTINGSGFQSGAGLKVTLTYAGGPTTTLSGGNIAWVNTSQVLALVTVGTTARTWTVTVTNPSGLTSAPANLSVLAPPAAPAITSLSPNPMTHSNSPQTLTINGAGFVAGAGLRVLAGYPGFTTALQGAQIISVTPTKITVLINVGNTPRPWSIEVVNPSGAASNIAGLQVK